MNNITFKTIMSRWRVIGASIIIFALIGFIVSSLLPAKYQSDISMIVIQKQATEKVDAFSATKSAEFLGNVFMQVIYTTSFFNAVQDAPFDVERNFSLDPEERQKQWDKFIDVKKVNNTGIIDISVFDVSRTKAQDTAKAIAYVLTTESEEYHGGGDRVEVRLIDGPNTPLRPTVPRILQNTIIGALFGGIVAIIFVYFFPDIITLSPKEQFHADDIVSDEGFSDENREEIKGTVADEGVVADHFHNAGGTIEFDEEVNELHKRIENFYVNNNGS